MSSKSKKELKANFQTSKKNVQINNYSTDKDYPVWVFDMLDRHGKFAFDISSDIFEHKDFLEKMIFYSNMSWSEIKKQTHDKGKSKHHFLELSKLSPQALERVKHLGYDKSFSDQIFSFAFNNTLRIIGIRIDEKFHVVWYDKEHKFCPSHLKHT